jgi:2-keto-3-deoxy-L-rhamnonate aldolase RhmA
LISLKSRMAKGELVVGLMISELRNPNFVFMLSQSGFDFFILDNEHGAYSPETVSDIIAAARGAGIAPIVRIPEIRRETILKPLDSGAGGLLVPQVNTVEQAKEVVFHAKYPPVGNRGAALRRPHSLYRKVAPKEYLAQANADTLIAVQAETSESIQNLGEIVAVPGIDVVFIGPFDLSISLGIPGDIHLPKEIEAIDKVLETCRQSNTAVGIQLFDVPSIKTWVQKGMRMISYSSDSAILADALATGVAEIKKTIPRG